MSQLPNRAYFSPGPDCLNGILESINSATSSLKLCVFTISDDRITDALVQAYKKGITIRIITDNKKLHDKGSDIKELAKRGVHVRVDVTPNHMHHKFAIIDDEAVLTGSYNWTRSAAEFNHENILITHDASTVKAYLKEFDKLWHQMEDFTRKSRLSRS